MENTATGFLKREHYLCRNFGNTSFTVNQHLLNESNLQWLKFFFNVLSQTNQPLEDYVVTIEKYHNFDWIYLGARKTDKFGQFTERLIPDTKYRFRAYSSKTCEMEKEWIIFLICKETPCTYDLSISETGKPYEILEDIDGFSYSFNYDKENKILLFGYDYTKNETFKIEFYVIKKSPEKEEKFCENVSFEKSGGFSCNLSNFTSGSFTAYAIVTAGSKKKTVYYNFDLYETSFGKEGLIWSALIILVLFLIGIWNPTVAIGGAILGILAVSLFGFASLPYLFIIFIIAIAIIIIIKLKT